MTLQTSGTISLSQINVELGRSADYTVSFHDSWMQSLYGLVSASAGTVMSISGFYGKTGIANMVLHGAQTTNLTYIDQFISGNKTFFNGVWRGMSNTFSGSGGGVSPFIVSTTAQSVGGESYLGPILVTNVSTGVSVRFTYLHRIDHGSGEIEDDWQGTTYPANFIVNGATHTYKMQATT